MTYVCWCYVLYVMVYVGDVHMCDGAYWCCVLCVLYKFNLYINLENCNNSANSVISSHDQSSFSFFLIPRY